MNGRPASQQGVTAVLRVPRGKRRRRLHRFSRTYRPVTGVAARSNDTTGQKLATREAVELVPTAPSKYSDASEAYALLHEEDFVLKSCNRATRGGQQHKRRERKRASGHVPINTRVSGCASPPSTGVAISFGVAAVLWSACHVCLTLFEMSSCSSSSIFAARRSLSPNLKRITSTADPACALAGAAPVAPPTAKAARLNPACCTRRRQGH